MTTLTQRDRDAVLQVHNEARAQVGVPALQWDDALARQAARYARSCIWGHWSKHRNRALPQPCFAQRQGRIVHTGYTVDGQCRAPGSSPPGENLAMGVPGMAVQCDPVSKREVGKGRYCRCGASEAECGATNWYNEVYDYRCGAPIDTGDCEPGEQCGHYTQMVSNMSTHVGCALATCPSMRNQDLPRIKRELGIAAAAPAQFLVCEYFPHGNIEGEYPFDTARVCPTFAQRTAHGLTPRSTRSRSHHVDGPAPVSWAPMS